MSPDPVALMTASELEDIVRTAGIAGDVKPDQDADGRTVLILEMPERPATGAVIRLLKAGYGLDGLREDVRAFTRDPQPPEACWVARVIDVPVLEVGA